MKSVKYTYRKVEELHIENPSAYQLDVAINILLYLLYCIFIHLCRIGF